MKRLLPAILVAVLASAANAQMTPRVFISHIAGTTSVTGTLCPYPTDGGCAGAPTDGTFQNATYFSGASVTHRMNWNVAGVDYPVGYRSSSALTDWQSFSHAGCSINTNQIRCDSQSNLVFDQIDFSLHGGAQLFLVNDSNTTVTNSKFASTGTVYTGLSVGPIQLSGGASGLDFEHNSVDGGCTTPGGVGPAQATLISTTGSGNSGTYTLKYNYFTKACQQLVELDGGTWVVEFNYIDNFNIEHLGHQNYNQLGTGTATETWIYNTTFQNTVGTGVGDAAGEGVQFYFNGSGTLNSITATNNTMMALQQTGANTMSYMMHGLNGSTTLSGACTVSSNYFDIVGALGAFYPSAGGVWTGCSASSANINLTDGTTITFPP